MKNLNRKLPTNNANVLTTALHDQAQSTVESIALQQATKLSKESPSSLEKRFIHQLKALTPQAAVNILLFLQDDTTVLDHQVVSNNDQLNYFIIACKLLNCQKGGLFDLSANDKYMLVNQVIATCLSIAYRTDDEVASYLTQCTLQYTVLFGSSRIKDINIILNKIRQAAAVEFIDDIFALLLDVNKTRVHSQTDFSIKKESHRVHYLISNDKVRGPSASIKPIATNSSTTDYQQNIRQHNLAREQVVKSLISQWFLGYPRVVLLLKEHELILQQDNAATATDQKSNQTQTSDCADSSMTKARLKRNIKAFYDISTQLLAEYYKIGDFKINYQDIETLTQDISHVPINSILYFIDNIISTILKAIHNEDNLDDAKFWIKYADRLLGTIQTALFSAKFIANHKKIQTSATIWLANYRDNIELINNFNQSAQNTLAYNKQLMMIKQIGFVEAAKTMIMQNNLHLNLIVKLLMEEKNISTQLSNMLRAILLSNTVQKSNNPKYSITHVLAALFLDSSVIALIDRESIKQFIQQEGDIVIHACSILVFNSACVTLLKTSAACKVMLAVMAYFALCFILDNNVAQHAMLYITQKNWSHLQQFFTHIAINDKIITELNTVIDTHNNQCKELVTAKKSSPNFSDDDEITIDNSATVETQSALLKLKEEILSILHAMSI